jgi:predicted transcriptional regulator
MNKLVCLNMPDDLIARLDAAALSERRSRSSMARLIIERDLKRQAVQTECGPPRETIQSEKELIHVV